VNYDENGICEVFTNLGRGGGCPSQSEATSRLISNALRAGMDVESIIEQLKGIRCHSTLRQKGLKVLSCPDAIGKAIEKVIKMKNQESSLPVSSEVEECGQDICIGDCRQCTADGCVKDRSGQDVCPDCGGAIEHSDGCVICRTCGYSKCK
jgi:ribonucleoside-diphosphate reductase alpha chain